MNQFIMSRGRTGKRPASHWGAETVVRNKCSYQVPSVVGTNASTNKKHKFYNPMVQAISGEGGYCATKVGVICARFGAMGSLVKNQANNWLNNLFDFRGDTIDVSDQYVFTLNMLVFMMKKERGLI